MFLKHGVDVNAPQNTYSALDCTILPTNCDIEVVELLLRAGADINHKNPAGNTALMSAVIKGHSDVVKKLLEYGSHVFTKNQHGADVLTIAAKAWHGKKEIFDLIKAHRKKIIQRSKEAFLLGLNSPKVPFTTPQASPSIQTDLGENDIFEPHVLNAVFQFAGLSDVK